MKNIILIIAFIFLVSIKSFAENSFVAILNVPVGLSVCIGDGLILAEPLNKIGINTGVNTKLGYMFDLGKIGITTLFELGYSYDSYGFGSFGESRFLGKVSRQSVDLSLRTHSFQIGIMPQINIENFAIGLGFGLKIPLAAEYEFKRTGSRNNDREIVENIKAKLNRKDIEDTYSRNIIPYLKLSFDYNFFFTEKFAVVVGAYLGYDFGLPVAGSFQNIRLDSLDITAQVGLRYGSKL
ncbi:hypothetical protein R4J03_11730 [Brachyspira intermedia]|uniref:hypothetical protein n=1 Tax=Brachyspira intermedia TaxID=84377 RepID=UPI003006EF9A